MSFLLTYSVTWEILFKLCELRFSPLCHVGVGAHIAGFSLALKGGLHEQENTASVSVHF